jgi:hypothetical protein
LKPTPDSNREADGRGVPVAHILRDAQTLPISTNVWAIGNPVSEKRARTPAVPRHRSAEHAASRGADSTLLRDGIATGSHQFRLETKPKNL